MSGGVVGSVGRAVARGAVWVVVGRTVVRCIGIVSTLILTRLLSPADFGIVAMAMVVIGLLESLSDFGVAPALIQRDELTDDYYHTAWAISIFRGLFLALLMALSAESIAAFYAEPRVADVVRALAVITLVRSFGCAYMINFQRNLQFDREFYFNLRIKIISFFATIIAAWYLRSYWALIFGIGLSTLLGVVFSYVVFPVRPRFSLGKFSEIFNFSKWIFVYRTIGYTALKFETIMLGRLAGPAATGRYDLAHELSITPSTELAMPIARALFPGLSRLQGDPKQFSEVLHLTLAFVMAVGLPAGIGLSMIATPLVRVLFSDEWQGLAPLIEILALFAVVRTIFSPTGAVFMAKGRIRTLTAIALFELVLKSTAIVVGWHLGGLQGVALAVLGAACCQAALFYVVLRRMEAIEGGKLMRAMWRSFAAAAAMVAVLRVAQGGLEALAAGPLLQVIVCVAAGAATYAAVHAALWYAVGQPAGIEALALKELRQRWRRGAA